MMRRNSDVKNGKKKLKSYKNEPKDDLSDDDIPLQYTVINKNANNELYQRQEMLNAVHSNNPLDLCCCCLELYCTKNLWLEYTWMGQGEVYGRMLKDCFGVTFPPEWECREKICEVCITRLRNSYRFKRQVVLCQAKMTEKMADIFKNNTINAETTVKIEHLEAEVLNKSSKIEMEKMGENKREIDYRESSLYEMNMSRSVESDHYVDSDRDNAEDYCEGDVKAYTKLEPVVKEKTKKTQIKKGYKLKRIPVKQIDRRTLSTHRSDYIKPRQNVSLLLEHSTIIPFKSNKGYFNCLYCNKQYVVFEELRAHVLQGHGDISFRAIVKSILRPNDRIKVDISDMTCRHCAEKSDTLETLIGHLKVHNIKFNYDEKILKPTDCVLPYNLNDGKFKCSECGKEFPFFKTLTKHMNEHSTNYVCDVCGKCFLLPERLRAHVNIHVSSLTVNCDVCGRVCASNAHLRSHKRHHHKKRSHVCCICNKSFATFKERMQHLQDVHNRTPPDLDCKICFKRFKTTSHLGCHVRTEHYNIPYVRKRKNKREGQVY